MSEMEQGVARNLLFLVVDRISSCGTNCWSLPRQKKNMQATMLICKKMSTFLDRLQFSFTIIDFLVFVQKLD